MIWTGLKDGMGTDVLSGISSLTCPMPCRSSFVCFREWESMDAREFSVSAAGWMPKCVS